MLRHLSIRLVYIIMAIYTLLILISMERRCMLEHSIEKVNLLILRSSADSNWSQYELILFFTDISLFSSDNQFSILFFLKFNLPIFSATLFI